MIVYLHPRKDKEWSWRQSSENIDLVAQLVEHLPFKEVVLGSSPSQVTIRNRIPIEKSGFFC